MKKTNKPARQPQQRKRSILKPVSSFTVFLGLVFLLQAYPAFSREMEDYPIVKLRSLDKVTARTMTFEADVGSTLKFGPLYIKIQSCRKAPPIEQPEASAFLQIWEVTPQDEAQWIFSGWMFASSPGLSSMDHPIYDVWVLDCLEKKGPEDKEAKQEEKARGEGEVPENKIPVTPEAPMEENIPVEDVQEN